MLVVRGGLSGESSAVQKIAIDFPTDQFYDLVCTYKDLVASFVGMCMSLFNTLVSWQNQGFLTLSITSQLTGTAALQMMQTHSVGAMVYNLLISYTLLPILALHRWAMCTLGGALPAEGSASITVQFGDLKMDPSWGACAPTGCMSTGLFGTYSSECATQSVQVGYIDSVDRRVFILVNMLNMRRILPVWSPLLDLV